MIPRVSRPEKRTVKPDKPQVSGQIALGDNAGKRVGVTGGAVGHGLLVRGHLNGAGADSFVLPKSEFADFSSFLAQTQTVDGNAVSTSINGNGDHLTLNGVTSATLAGLSANFKFV